MKTKTKVNAGSIEFMNHNQTDLKVATAVKAGMRLMNHNQTCLKLATKVKAGQIDFLNHNQTARQAPSPQ